MPAISMSAIEVLPALLNKTKVTTIRPLSINFSNTCDDCGHPKPCDDYRQYGHKWEYEDPKDKMSIIIAGQCIVKGCSCKRFNWYKKPRYKVGDICNIYWKQRSRAKWFCSGCGIASWARPEETQGDCPNSILFPKLLGKVKIMKVETFIWDKHGIQDDEPGFYGSKFDEAEMAHQDGFKTIYDMYAYFNKNYDFSTPKSFVRYHMKWL